MLFIGSRAGPPHSAPPSNPGKINVPSSEGGENMSSFKSEVKILIRLSLSLSITKELISFLVNDCLENGSGKSELVESLI